MKRVSGLLLAIAFAGCASSAPQNTGGPRPPEGPGRAGIDFQHWDRDAEGAVDQGFRAFITSRYPGSDIARARTDLEADGFKCQDGNRPEAHPVPQLECIRLYKAGEDVHAWSVEFWPNDPRPKARYTRTHMRDPMRTYDDKQKRH
jgi:hypothetical protein